MSETMAKITMHVNQIFELQFQIKCNFLRNLVLAQVFLRRVEKETNPIATFYHY